MDGAPDMRGDRRLVDMQGAITSIELDCRRLRNVGSERRTIACREHLVHGCCVDTVSMCFW